MISPTDLRYFREVSATGNLRRAGERLGVSQPALSHALKRLEDEFGSQLFIREKTGVRLTRAGERLVALANELEETWSRIHSAVSNEMTTVEGMFRIGCHSAVGQYTLGKFLTPLLKNHPKIHVRLEHALSRTIAEGIAANRIDFGFVVNPPKHPDFVIKQLCEDRVRLWKSPRLANPDILICDPNLFQVSKLVAQAKRKGIEFKREIHSSSLEMIARLTIEGAGVGIVPERVMKAMGGDCVPLSTSAPDVRDEICLVYKRENQTSAAARVIIDAVKSLKL